MQPVCLVTGGLGFMGSFAVKALVDAGCSVVVFDTKIKDNSFSLSMPENLLQKLKVIEGDILDEQQLIKAIKDNSVSVVVHLAAILLAETIRNPPHGVAVNCAGTTSVFEAAKKCGVERVVWASSIAVYGLGHYGPEARLTDGSTQYPDEIYGACKAFCEDLAKIYLADYGVRNIGLRFGHGTGTGRQRGGGAWAAAIVDKPALGQPSVLPHGDELENWLSVEDQASSVVAACLCPAPTKAEVVTIAGFDIRTRRQAADYVKRLIPDAQITVEPGTLGRPVNYDIEGAHRLLGWKPKFDMEATLESMIRRIRLLNGLPDLGTPPRKGA